MHSQNRTHLCVGDLLYSQWPKARSNPSVSGHLDKWINKVWAIHTMEYYSALIRKEILTPATTWMNLEDIMLSEISQIQKG